MLEKDLEEAEATLLMALEFVTNLDYKKENAEICALLGKFYVDIGQERRASDYLARGIEIFKNLGVFKNIH
jgi:hypothetical protein